MPRGVAPAQFPPPVDPAREFIGPPTDPEEERIEVGVAIVGGGPAGLACAIRLTQLLEHEPELTDKLGEVPVAVIEKGKTPGAHLLSGANMRPSAMKELFPDLPESEWPVLWKVEKDAVYLLTKKQALPLKPMPPNFRNHGNYVVSVAQLGRWLAERAERVLVTDLDTRFLEELPDNVDVQLHDVTAEPPALDDFDLVHARALLEHVPERDVALANLVRSLRPGGWLLAEDVAFPCFPLVVYPEWPLTEKLNAAAAAGFRAAGADSEYGVKLLGRLDEAGLVESGAEVHVPAARTGTADVDFVALTLEQLGDKLVAAGLLTAEDVRDGVDAMREPGRVVLGPLMVAAWGRRPPD